MYCEYILSDNDEGTTCRLLITALYLHSDTENKKVDTGDTKVINGGSTEVDADKETTVPVTEQKVHSAPKEKAKFRFLHDIAEFHAMSLRKQQERKNLLHDVGPFRRALCARRDLRMRRRLCKVEGSGVGAHVLRKYFIRIHSLLAHDVHKPRSLTQLSECCCSTCRFTSNFTTCTLKLVKSRHSKTMEFGLYRMVDGLISENEH